MIWRLGASIALLAAAQTACDFRVTDDFWTGVASSCECFDTPHEQFGHCRQLRLSFAGDGDPSSVMRCHRGTSAGCIAALQLWWDEIRNGCSTADPNYWILEPAMAQCTRVSPGVWVGLGIVVVLGAFTAWQVTGHGSCGYPAFSIRILSV